MKEALFQTFRRINNGNIVGRWMPKIPHTGAQLQPQIRLSGKGWSKIQFGK
jgi:hypothetical protein